MSVKKITDLSTRQVLSLKQIAALIAEGENSDTIQSRWETFVFSAATSGDLIDVNALVQYVLREAYGEQSQDFYYYAYKVKYFNAAKEKLRNMLLSIRQWEQDLREQLTAGEQRLLELDDLGRLAAEDLQKEAEKTQEFIQLIASIQKRLNDSAQEVLNNLK